jgi:hypothetical protein
LLVVGVGADELGSVFPGAAADVVGIVTALGVTET